MTLQKLSETIVTTKFIKRITCKRIFCTW